MQEEIYDFISLRLKTESTISRSQVIKHLLSIYKPSIYDYKTNSTCRSLVDTALRNLVSCNILKRIGRGKYEKITDRKRKSS